MPSSASHPYADTPRHINIQPHRFSSDAATPPQHRDAGHCQLSPQRFSAPSHFGASAPGIATAVRRCHRRAARQHIIITRIRHIARVAPRYVAFSFGAPMPELFLLADAGVSLLIRHYASTTEAARRDARRSRARQAPRQQRIFSSAARVRFGSRGTTPSAQVLKTKRE